MQSNVEEGPKGMAAYKPQNTEVIRKMLREQQRECQALHANPLFKEFRTPGSVRQKKFGKGYAVVEDTFMPQPFADPKSIEYEGQARMFELIKNTAMKEEKARQGVWASFGAPYVPLGEPKEVGLAMISPVPLPLAAVWAGVAMCGDLAATVQVLTAGAALRSHPRQPPQLEKTLPELNRDKMGSRDGHRKCVSNWKGGGRNAVAGCQVRGRQAGPRMGPWPPYVTPQLDWRGNVWGWEPAIAVVIAVRNNRVTLRAALQFCQATVRARGS